MATELSSDDEGKTVVSSNDTEIGVVKEVEGDTAHVDPDPGLTDDLKSKLGWADKGGDTYPVEAGDITTVTDDEVRLGRVSS